MPRYTVLSPHFDDAVLSLGGWLAAHPGEATVVTVCGGVPAAGVAASRWDAQAGFASGSEAALARQREDVAACARLGAAHVHVPYLDAPYRTADVDRTPLGEMLRELAAGGDVVFAPAGVGDHVDHVLVHDLAREMSAAELWLYADLPYAARADGWRTGEPGEWLAGPAWQAKRDALFAYASQLAPLGAIFGNVVAADGPLRREVTWRVEPVRPRGS